MKNTFLILFLSSFILLFSCKKEDKTYQGQPLVEFTKNEISQVIPFTEKTDISIPVKIQLNSKAFSENKVVQIIEVGTNSAINNKHYSINDYKTVFLADSVFATFNVSIKSDNFAEGETVSVTFKISDASEIKASENFNSCKLTISKQSFINVFVGKYICSEPVNQDTYTTTFVAGSTSNTIKNLNFWNFPAVGQSLIYTISKDASMKVEIIEQNWIDKNGQEYKISGKGTYDLQGNMIVNYTVLQNGSIYEEGVHTFTHLK